MRDYALGRSDSETKRLVLQERVLRPFTERMFDEVGLGPGMSVLDLGCGAGGAAVQAASRVGDSGRVVAIDQDEAVLALARERFADVPTVEFRHGSVESFDDPEPFDLVMCRCVMFFTADPLRFLRTARSAVRPGGVLAVQEPHARWVPPAGDGASPVGQFSAPRVEDIERVGEAFTRALEAAAPSHDVAPRLAGHFADAGLPEPELTWNIVVGSGPNSPLYELLARALRSVAPQLARFGIDGFDDLVAHGSLTEHLRGLAVEATSQVFLYSLVSAWARP